MENEKKWSIWSKIHTRLPPLPALLYLLFFREADWLLQLTGVLAIASSALCMVETYQKGLNKFYYVVEALTIVLSIYVIIIYSV